MTATVAPRWLRRRVVVKIQWADLDLESGGAMIFDSRVRAEQWHIEHGGRRSSLEPQPHRSALARRFVVEGPWKLIKVYEKQP